MLVLTCLSDRKHFQFEWNRNRIEDNIERAHTLKINIFIWCSILADDCGYHCSFFAAIFSLSLQTTRTTLHPNIALYVLIIFTDIITSFAQSVTEHRANRQVTLFCYIFSIFSTTFFHCVYFCVFFLFLFRSFVIFHVLPHPMIGRAHFVIG